MQQASSPLVSLSPVFCAVSLSYLPQIVLGHSGPFLSLRTNDATRTSLPSPCSLVADRKFWAISLQTVVVRRLFCVLFFGPPCSIAL